MKNTKKAKAPRIREKKNLSIVNSGDVVIIKNKSSIAGAVLGAIILSFFATVLFLLKDARQVTLFWLVFAFLTLSAVYFLTSALLGKIVLNSPEKLMTVYFPIKKEYKFDAINYIDCKSSKPKEGIVTHTVVVYIGNGKRRVEVATTSRAQADELVALLRGMLDNGAMEFPEGDEEPFNFDDKRGRSAFSFLKKKSDSQKSLTDEECEFAPIEKKAASHDTDGAEDDASGSDDASITREK